jgi:cell surface protein SprA
MRGFNNIRFMRMFLTGFGQPVFLRFATLELVRSEWRTYTQSLQSGGTVAGPGKLEVSTVSIEENGDRTPVNYVLPPGVTRILDPSQPQLRQQNEQAIALKVKDLDPCDSRDMPKKR